MAISTPFNMNIGPLKSHTLVLGLLAQPAESRRTYSLVNVYCSASIGCSPKHTYLEVGSLTEIRTYLGVLRIRLYLLVFNSQHRKHPTFI